MAEVTKKKRTQSLSKFTLNVNKLTKLINNNAPLELVRPQYEKVQECWNILEEAHDTYLEEIDEEDLEGAGGLAYLDKPGDDHSTVLVLFAAYLKGQDEAQAQAATRRAEQEQLLESNKRVREAKERKDQDEAVRMEELTRQFDSLKSEVDSEVGVFGRSIVNLEDVLKDASGEDKRSKWQKVETEFNQLKDKYVKLGALDPARDIADLSDKFKKDAEELFLAKQTWILPLLKDTSPVVASVTSGGSGSTRKETVKLPKFSGEEKTIPYLKFPTWKKEWDKVIVEYDTQWHARILKDHLDEAACKKIVGFETDYVEAMRRLENYYGNPQKVIACVMKEVTSSHLIAEGDYNSLVAYSDILENNHTRLNNLGFVHELSNTTTMSLIVQKFPRLVGEAWNVYLTGKTTEEQMKPFPLFVEWVKSQKIVWERMVATAEVGKKFKGPGQSSFFAGGEERDPVKTEKACHRCRKVGHLIRDCPEKDSKPPKKVDKKQPRKQPRVKKFWCALHKDDPNRRCSSESCPDLRRLTAKDRVKLIQDNGDCFHCMCDHKPEDCQRKHRVCGGGKEDRGCTRSHNVHELLCLEARVFASFAPSGQLESVMLLVMAVWAPKKKKANLMYDGGSTVDFVTESCAKQCGFRGEKQQLNVTTLGGVVTDLEVTAYQCSLRDANGNFQFFEAYGMESITGTLTTISETRLKELFPHLSRKSILQLLRGDQVDFLIGMGHASWFPERVEQAAGDGDFWRYKGQFGTCYGGRLPGVQETARKSDQLFEVNHVYNVSLSANLAHKQSPHELEYCPRRIAGYTVPEQSLKQVPVVADQLLQVPDVPDQSLHTSVISDHSLHAPVVSDQSFHVSVAPDQSLHVPVVPDQMSVAPDQSSHAPVVTDHPVHIPVVLDQSLHTSDVPDQPEHLPVVPDHPVHIPVVLDQSLHTSDVPDQSVHIPFVLDQSLHVPVVPDQSMHISVGSDQYSHVPVDPNQSNVTDHQSYDSIVADDQSLQGFIVPERSQNTGYTDQLSLNGLSGSDHLHFGSVVPKEVVDNGVSPVSFSSSLVPGEAGDGGLDVPVMSSSSVVAGQDCVGNPVSSHPQNWWLATPFQPSSQLLQDAAVDSVAQETVAGAKLQSQVAVNIAEPVLQGTAARAELAQDAVGRAERVAAAASAEFLQDAVGIAERVVPAASAVIMQDADGKAEHMVVVSAASADISSHDAVEEANLLLERSAVEQKPWYPESAVGSDWDSCVGAGTGACFAAKASPLFDEELFFKSQDLGVVVDPQCGDCKCGKCPIPGSLYSFKEQTEHDKIKKALYRVEGVDMWVTELPWNCARSNLPRNDKSAFQNLVSLERTLRKVDSGDDFAKQIQDMVDRGAAVILSDKQVSSWEGDYYFLPMVAVKGKKWLRVCFDASRRQGRNPSLNDCLLKGPDRFINNLLAVILGFRNGRVGAAADISKFHNRVLLEEKDMHMQRFLWRDMDSSAPPRVYAVPVNCFGVKPANCIATCALHRSAELFAEKYPEESQELKDQTYVDDQLIAAPSKDLALQKTKRMDEITDHAGMPNKGWTFSGDDVSLDFEIGGNQAEMEKVLGILWSSVKDAFYFQVVLQLGPDPSLFVFTSEDLDMVLLYITLTRRILLANVARIFDPVGFLAPIILLSKLLMRESWSGSVTGWDEALPEDLNKRWVSFLKSLLKLKDLEFQRSLWPEEDVVGLPSLVVFSDGSKLAFGAVAYIRWQLKSGGYWSRFIMAKCKIAPKGIVSIPRMELNGAVMGNRIRNFLVKETNIKFGQIYQLVDSSTVLGYVQKECGNFRPYEGIRIGEIQSSNTLVDGKLLGWAWVAGEDNPSDWCTKPRAVEDLLSDFWLCGPAFLTQDVSCWPIKDTYKKDGLEGELNVPRGVFAVIVDLSTHTVTRVLSRSSSWKKAVKVMGWILCVFSMQSLKVRTADHLELDLNEMKSARVHLIKFAQKSIVEELKEAAESGSGRYRKLAPMCDEEGIWRVGSRLINHVPFTFDNKLPILLPPDHRLTRLLMEDSHLVAHPGQDGTLARFRSSGYWTVRGGLLAKKVRNSCVPCRKEGKELLYQPMGEFPPDMLKNPVAWGCCQMDLFGPYSCRGDVNPRTTKKTWALVIEDINSGAVHLDIVQDYSAEAVLLSLRRFGSLRGWPCVLHSDPGSQLVSASGKLEAWWKHFEGRLRRFGAEKNFQWKISPPDSPWRQGKVERRIAIVKRLLHLSLGDTRVTPVEFQTILFEVANMCNERPLGLSRPREDGTYTLITPNQLMLGRSQNILPDDATIANDLPMSSRYRLVNHVTSVFWSKWSVHVSPGLIVRQKWHNKTRNLQVGDLVMIADTSKVKSKYKLGVVEDTNLSRDGFVRSATLRYCNVEKNHHGTDIVTTMRVKRSVQRLVLVMPVEEMTDSVVVKEYEEAVHCVVQL